MVDFDLILQTEQIILRPLVYDDFESIKKFDFERVEFKTDVLNMPARKALLKFGAKEEGVLRSHTLMNHNRRRDTIYYSVLKSEWNAIKIKNNWQ